MSRVLLIYPFFRPRHDDTEFRFPPLGLAYIAAALRARGHAVSILDCSFLTRGEALRRALEAKADIAGIQAMITLEADCLALARALRPRVRLLVAGGALPSIDPAPFLAAFDLVVRGEGEETMCDIADRFERGESLSALPGVVASRPRESGPPRPLVRDLDSLPLPARDLLPNRSYIAAARRRKGRATATIMSSRGCPFACEFCSNAVFGSSYRERSSAGVVDEMEELLAYGYERVHFADDVFTLRKERLLGICAEIEARSLAIAWECLGRVDSIDEETARAMRAAGCDRIFFGIESGSERVLALMRKGTSPARAARAVETAHAAGIRTGAFFILFYPGGDDESVLETLRFSSTLPLDYRSYGLPRPIPGTALYERLKREAEGDGRKGRKGERHAAYAGAVSAAKMGFALMKARIEDRLLRHRGIAGRALYRAFSRSTEAALRRLR